MLNTTDLLDHIVKELFGMNVLCLLGYSKKKSKQGGGCVCVCVCGDGGGVGVDMEFWGVLKKKHVEIPGVN